jgi:ubiquinone/menaquinone biosynthesis C-methylase UbiE
VPDRKALLDEMYSLLKPGGRLLVVEPDFHADRINFTQTLSLAAAAGFSSPVKRKVTISRAVVLGK